MFTPEKADEIESRLRKSPEVDVFHRIEDGQEFTIFVRFGTNCLSVPLKMAMMTADAFDIDFSRDIIRLYLVTDEDLVFSEMEGIR